MRKFLFIVSANCLLLAAGGQVNYRQQEVNYSIDVSLNDKDHSLDGFERIEYINHSPDTLYFIWFHLWPNAYKNDKTAFSDQLLQAGNTSFYFSDKEQKGYINRLDFKVDNITASTEDHPEHIDIVKLILPAPLAPEQKIIITTPFHVKLPYNFSRGGHDGDSYQVTQWYPKPAVYDSKGWHPIPYLDQGEFYSEFGTYDVSITLPDNYAVAATGELQNEEEKEWLKTRYAFTWTPTRKKVKTKSGGFKTQVQKFPASSTKNKTLQFKQDRVHDFAWFADKRFIVAQEDCRLPSGKTIRMLSYYTATEKEKWQKSMAYARQAIQFYSAELGEYPYNVVSVVQVPKSFGGGMEYPTITVIAPTESAMQLDLMINHEIGHNWFYGILASNERAHPWMDEGMTSFYENRYASLHKSPSNYPGKASFQRRAIEKKDQPIATPAEKFNTVNYDLTAYYKTAEWMRWLESQLGSETFNRAMQAYYRRWQFKHPQPGDFKKVLEESSGRNLDSAFSYLDKKGILPNQQRHGTMIASPSMAGKASAAWFNKVNSQKNVIWLSPAVGINSYDKFMIGGLVSNIKPIPSKLQFFLAPLYATGSKKFTGIGFINYSFYPDGLLQKIDLGVSGSKFSENEFKKENGTKAYFGFQKLAPRIRFTLKEKSPLSTTHRYIQWKSYFFTEQSYRVRYDSVFSPPDTLLQQVLSLRNNSRTLNQLKLVIENYRALYPYRGELKIEQGNYFVRVAFTGNYFFNYAKEGGLDVRFFAGKFFYAGSKTLPKQIDTDRYHLNLTGANGYEDYTYSDYFVGRNKFEGAASQQIMVRDGAFKVRTDLLSEKVGRTDNWLIAANFSSTIPSQINPLNVLPVKIPLKVFVDIGTYAEAWEKNANVDRFLFDAGIQIPILKETVNIYIPLLFSRVFKDYKDSYLPKKNRFFKMMSFSIDISNFSFRKFDRNFDL